MVMALWHFVGGIYGKLAEIWRFIEKICKKVEEAEQNELRLTIRDDVKVQEEICRLNMTIEALREELNAIHVRHSKQKQQRKRKTSQKSSRRRASFNKHVVELYKLK